jgi:4-carboxymuconolactone decarboxylase
MMTRPRFETLTPETMTPQQRAVADAIEAGPRGKGLPGPFNALLRNPALCDLLQQVGAHVRFRSTIPPALNEMAICLAGRKWSAQFEFYAHRRMALEAGLGADILDAIAVGERPSAMSRDETIVYDFVHALLHAGRVADEPFERAKSRFGEVGLIDLIAAAGYYTLVSMVLNVAEVPVPDGVEPPLPLLD